MEEYLIETDILIEYLKNTDENMFSILEKAMKRRICFTTVMDISEIIFAERVQNRKDEVKSLLGALNVLRLHARYSLYISDFFNKVATTRDAIMCVVAKINKLPILTIDIGRYKNSGIEIINLLEL